MSSSSGNSASSRRLISDTNPVLRNAVRFSISAKEEELLRKYLKSRKADHEPSASSPPITKKGHLDFEEEYNVATVRLAGRLFVSTFAVLKLWELLMKRFGRGDILPCQKVSFLFSPSFRLSLSTSTILFFHRLLYRFFLRLREALRMDDARIFCKRNPRTSRALKSQIAPALGASLAGVFLGLIPAGQTRITITIYTFTRALEFVYNAMDEQGLLRRKPWWFGSWLLMPAACGQLVHAFVFDRDCVPETYGNFVLNQSPAYIQKRPHTRPSALSWPTNLNIVDSLASISHLKWPSFTSPILIPSVAKPSPVSPLSTTTALTNSAHPAITRLSCALLHPHSPSCSYAFLSHHLLTFPSMTKLFTLIYALSALPRYRDFLNYPITSFNTLAKKILATSFVLTSATGTLWSSICLFQRILPPSFLPTGRWYLSGFLAGMWAFLARRGGQKSNFLFTARLSLDSLWKVGKKRGWWKGLQGGDVWLFVVCLGVIGAVYERRPAAVKGPVIRKGLGVLRGEGWVDRSVAVQKGVVSRDEHVETEKKGVARIRSKE